MAPHIMLGGGSGTARGGRPPLPAPRLERPTAVHQRSVPHFKPPPPQHMKQRPKSDEIITKSSPHEEKYQSDSTIIVHMPNWYRPHISREEAISFVRNLDPGSFIIRDSTTVPGGYALTVNISKEQARQRRKMDECM